MNRVSDKQSALPPAWQTILDASQAGIFLLDQNFVLIWANAHARGLRQLTCNEDEVPLGTSFPLILPEKRREDVLATLEKAGAGITQSYEVMYDSLDGKPVWFQVHYSPIPDDEGTTKYICVTVNNITELKQKESALLQSEQRWKFALEGTGNGVWEYNFETGEAFYSPFYKKMLGYSEHEFNNSVEEWQARIHPEDLERVEVIDGLYMNGQIETHSIEYRMRNRSGEYTWVLDRGMLLQRNNEGKPVKLIGTNQDITFRKLAEEKIMLSEQRFASFMDNSPTMTWIMDEHHIFRYMNEPYMRTFNLTSADIGRNMYDIFPGAVCDVFARNNELVWKTDSPLETIESGVGPDGIKQVYQIFKFPLKKENGSRLLGGVALDITQKLAAEKALSEERERSKRALIQGIIDAQEKERDELAYQLHENVNQVLTSAKIMLEMAAEKPELIQEFVSRSLPYISEAIVELRKLSHSLRPATLNDISLEAAIAEEVQMVNNKKRIKVSYSYRTNGFRKDIHSDIQLVLLRTVQEQLSNIVKHAAANKAEVNLEINDDRLSLSIVDNGKGFDPDHVPRSVGLNNIINRVEFHKGNWKLVTTPGNGCSLLIDIPI